MHNNKTFSLYASPGNIVNFSGAYADAIFGDNMIKYMKSAGHSEYDKIQEYNLNSEGYRGPEFTNNVDLVFAGCSFTYGMGVPENGIWGSIVAERNGLTYNNLSKNGVSVPWIVKQLFAYFKEYGNPKTLLCLFPNITRTFFPSNPDILTSDDQYIEDSTLWNGRSIYNTELCSIPGPEDMPKYSKRPHQLEDVMSLDFVVSIAMQNIRLLEQYCRSSGIDFYWTTWSEGFADMIENQGMKEAYDFSHYVDAKHNFWNWNNKTNWHSPDVIYKTIQDRDFCAAKHKDGCDCHISCHQDLVDKYSDSFYLGTDIYIRKMPHFGVHRHIHYAESFLKAMEKSNSDKQS